MSQAIKLPDTLIEEARRSAAVYSRSIPKQIEHWSRIGRIAEQNPEMPYRFIMDLLAAREEKAEPFDFEK